MSSRLPKHLFDAKLAAGRALAFLGGLDDATCESDVLVRSAVERQLEILGEASRRALDDEPGLRERIPELALAIGLRNRVIHGYDRIDHALLAQTVRRDLPPLMERLEVELRAYPLDEG